MLSTIANIVHSVNNSKYFLNFEYTPYVFMYNLSKKLNNRIWFKREDLTPIHTFKLRGAFHNIMTRHENDNKLNTVITCSAGNHAAGVAYTSKMLNIKNNIVIPSNTAKVKIDKIKSLGGNVIVRGSNYDEAQKWTLDYASFKGYSLIHPFNDILTISGQATIAYELLRQHDINSYGLLDYIFVPVGGGGLIAGITTYFNIYSPNTRIIGVEEYGSNALSKSHRKGELVELANINTFCDGAAVRSLGDIPYKLIRHKIYDVVEVSENDICNSIRDIYNETRTIIEPAGALSWAGCKKYLYKNGLESRNIAILTTGANMDLDRLVKIMK